MTDVSRRALLLRSGRSKFLESVAQELQEAGGTTFGFGLPSNHTTVGGRVAQAFELSSISNGAGAPSFASSLCPVPGHALHFVPRHPLQVEERNWASESSAR